MVKLHYFLKVLLKIIAHNNGRQSLCYKTKKRGIPGMVNSAREHPLQASPTISSQVLLGNGQHSHTGVCTIAASSANKSADHRNALKLNKPCKGPNSNQRPLGMLPLPQLLASLNGHRKVFLPVS